MDKFRELLEECVRTTQWRSSYRCITPDEFKHLYPDLRGDTQSQFEFLSYKPIPSQTSLNRLTTQLRSLLEKFISPDTDRIGLGFSAVLGEDNTLTKPTIPEFAKTLLKPATVLGPSRVTKQLAGWASDEPLRFQECALLDGVRIERDLEFPGGITLMKLPPAWEDLPSWLPYFDPLTSGLKIVGSVVMRIEWEKSPALYPPSDEKTGILSQELLESFRCNSKKNPSQILGTFCESLSLACDHYVHWQSIWRDHCGLQLFSDAPIWGGIYKAPSSPPPKVMISQEKVEQALSIYSERNSTSKKGGLDIAIRRWMNSKQRRSHEDKFIDLRIALEALYLKDGFGELKYRMAINCAWHLGSDFETRRSYFKKLRELYNTASKAVHGKGINYSDETRDILASAQDICRNGILRRLKEDKEPNWEKLVLGQSLEAGS